MLIARSKLTAQHQISVPAAVRKILGLAPGSVLEWTESGDSIVIRRIGQHSSGEIHHALFPKSPAIHSAAEMKAGIRARMRKKYARR